MQDAKEIVTVRDVRKRFGETVALDGLTVTIRPGEVHAIVGENGSGKSTLAKILSGVLNADSGEVKVLGETPLDPIQARKIGVATIFQEVLVADNLTIVDNLFAGTDTLWRRGRSPADARRQSREMLLRFTGLDLDPDMPVRNLPLSVRQWIVIARALLCNPKVLILDESSAALDLEATAKLHVEIRKLRDAGCCIVIVTHRIAELIRITDRATVLRDGKTVGELVGKEITEANLLALMSPKRSLQEIRPETRNPARIAAGETALSGSRIGVRVGAAPFDFTLRSGEILGVTGLDGQGQSHFLRVAAGILPPFSGRIAAAEGGAERPISSLAEASDHGIVYVSGDRAREGIFPNLSIFENFAIALYRSCFGQFGWIRNGPVDALYQKERQRLAIRAGRASNRITSLSGGNQQKVLIARALAAEPKVIVLDDPARGVDLQTKRDLYIQLKAFTAGGGAVIYLSSEIEEFFDFADRVMVFRNGSLFRTLSGTEIAEHALLAAMFGHTDDIEPLVSKLEEAS
ncbi:sugar ABC transporter ATP-binding protein [Hypericibacter adhaerens]|uniref:Sugar ABC transporter ATP-binding protein n=1 Tax=Hypericibacter adhaerens TaxID=2602016 RepID=A0A5J6N2D9_9PROT|nr:sugar ABC transporter ATP-binding protein [Hypericibacter adhaerens]QEX22750.1 sugar ABC transporter ATP-binding protein [Hypericibacter adhaerens]